MANFLKYFMVTFVAAALAACGGDEPDNPNAESGVFTLNDIIGVWECDDDYFPINRLKFEKNGTAVYEYGNVNSNLQQRYFDYRLEENGDKVFFDNAVFTDLPYATLGRDAQNNLILFAIGYTYHKVSGSHGDNNDVTEGVITKERLKQLADKMVSITARYSDYFWRITIKSKLHKELKSAIITFGFGCGELADKSENIMFETNLASNRYCSYRKQISGDSQIIEIEVPFWYYYIFGYTVDDDIAAKCAMYYASYVALMAQDASTWTGEERDLYKELVRYLNEYEQSTEWDFRPSVYVDADGCCTMLARYKR